MSREIKERALWILAEMERQEKLNEQRHKDEKRHNSWWYRLYKRITTRNWRGL